MWGSWLHIQTMYPNVSLCFAVLMSTCSFVSLTRAMTRSKSKNNLENLASYNLNSKLS